MDNFDLLTRSIEIQK